MKKSILTIAILLSGVFITTQLLTSCGGKTETHDEMASDSTSQDEMKMDSTATAYACPMHPEVTGKEGDTCSKCGMKLEAIASADSTVHQH